MLQQLRAKLAKLVNRANKIFAIHGRSGWNSYLSDLFLGGKAWLRYLQSGYLL